MHSHTRIDSQGWLDLWGLIHKWKTPIQTNGEKGPRGHRNNSVNIEKKKYDRKC